MTRRRIRFRRRRDDGVDVGEIRRTFRRFRPALAGQGRPLALAIALAVCSAALELLRPWPISWMVDHLISSMPTAGSTTTPTTGLEPILIAAGAALVVPVLLGFATERLEIVIASISRTATVRLRGQVFTHLHRLELPEFRRHHSGDLLVRLMGDVNMVRDLLVPSWINLLARGSVLIGAIVVFAVIDWRLLLVALVPLPLLWISLERTSKEVRKAAGKQRRKEGAIASQAAESLRQMGLIKAFAAEARATEQFVDRARRTEKATMAAARNSAKMGRTTEIITGMGVALVLVAGALRVRSGALTPGELVLVISYTRMLYKPVRKLSGEGARIAKALACANRIMDLLERPVERDDVGDPVGRLAGHIEFRGVGHRYEDGRGAIGSLNAAIPAGSLVAVTGENGTGKSTLLTLLLRLQRPSEGCITVDGVDISTLQLSSYREQLAYVPQELALFAGTIRDNIRFARPDATDEEILAAADAALFTPVLARLPDGLDTELQEAGGSLSGGQARRLMLARAALRDASVLLLDEPLAGLDPDARLLVARAISNIADGRTTLVVHHGELDELRPDYELNLDLSRSAAGAPHPLPAMSG